MPVDKFDAVLAPWGCLVKSWATKLDYVSPGTYDDAQFGAQPPRPPTGPTDAGHIWALPVMAAVPVQAESGGTINLPNAIGLTIQQFKDRLADAKVGILNMPAQYTHVVVVQGDVSTMVVRLPPRDILQASEDDIAANGYTDPPLFYQDLYTPPGGPRVGPFMPLTPPDKMHLHANRIGDYTLNSCS